MTVRTVRPPTSVVLTIFISQASSESRWLAYCDGNCKQSIAYLGRTWDFFRMSKDSGEKLPGHFGQSVIGHIWGGGGGGLESTLGLQVYH